MVSDSFVKFSKKEIQSFSEEQENTNTKKKTSYDVKLFKQFLSSEEQEREIEEIPAEERLQGLAITFVLGVRKKNGEEYEHSSIRGFLQSVDRYLRKKGYKFSLLNDTRKNSAVFKISSKRSKNNLKPLEKGTSRIEPIHEQMKKSR